MSREKTLNPPSNFSHKVTQRDTKEIRSLKIILIKSFLGVQGAIFQKSPLAAGGKSDTI
jgi:hypothetical protein